MWGAANLPQPHPGMYGGGAVVAPAVAQQSSGQQKHDIFVGNLAFQTTEEQLHQAFSEIGRVLNVRLVTDVDTGKPRGFAFIEFQDPQAALSAIRNMNDYELNGRRLRVNFSNSSHLEALAGKLGMDLSHQTQRATAAQAPASTGTNAVADALKSMSKAEMYNVIAKMKEIADRDPDEARRVIASHPQLPEAILFLMSKLDMVKTPVASEVLPSVLPVAVAQQPAPVRADPRAAMRADPRQKPPAVPTPPFPTAPVVPVAVAPAVPAAPPRIDPRQRADPRARPAVPPAPVPPPPPPPMAAQPPPPYGMPPPVLVPPPRQGVAHLDPALVQQVMSLTPHQIQQLPPDKQQSIIQLRQQITGGTGM